MPKKSKWQSNVWKTIIGLSVVIGLIASALQIFGAVDFWSLLILPIYTFLVSSVSVYYVVLFIVVFITVAYFMVRLRGYGKCILDSAYPRQIAMLCQTPRTTEYLREKYEEWESQSSWVVLGGYNFDDYMKRLEKKVFLNIVMENGKSQTRLLTTSKSIMVVNSSIVSF